MFGTSRSARSPLAFASIAEGRYGCAFFARVHGSVNPPKTPAGVAEASTLNPAAAAERRWPREPVRAHQRERAFEELSRFALVEGGERDVVAIAAPGPVRRR